MGDTTEQRFVKSYLVFEKGLIEATIFYLKDRLTIGRHPENDIYLADARATGHHAVVTLDHGHAVIEDLKSLNGTFLNGERVQKAALSTGDRIRCGGSEFRFAQESLTVKDVQDHAETPAAGPEVSTILNPQGPSRPSQRLLEVVAKLPLFESLDADGLREITQVARLMVYDQDQIVFQQGDVGRSLYIVLDGKVRVFTRDCQGKVLSLAVLGDTQFFGEMSFITGEPRSATVKALENTLLCEIDAGVLRSAMHQWPAIKNTIVRNYNARQAQTSAKKRALGCEDRRTPPRFNLTLPVSFTVMPTTDMPTRLRQTVFRFLTKDISVNGMRLRVNDRELLGLPMGCSLKVEITLPQPWKAVRCRATVRNLVTPGQRRPSGYLSLEFEGLSSAARQRLEQYLAR